MRKQWKACLAVGMAVLLLTGNAGLGRLEMGSADRAYAQEAEFTIANGILTAYNGTGGEVVIPDGVAEIGEAAFKDCDLLTNVIIPPNVKIGKYAFENCVNLVKAELGEGVEFSYHINIVNDEESTLSAAFKGCTNLKDINLPSNMTRIYGEMFCDCTNLEKIILPEGITEIDHSAFKRCSELAAVNIPEGVTRIKVSAFESCRSLTQVILPDSLTSIGQWAFEFCNNLSDINIPVNCKNIGENAFWNTEWLRNKKTESSLVIEGHILIDGKDCTDTAIKIPDGVEAIADNAFSFCNMTDVWLPDSLTSIGKEAFRQCVNLENIKMPEGVKWIGENAFWRTKWQQDRLEEDRFAVINGILVASDITQGELVIPDGIIGIAGNAFDVMAKPSFTSITIPESVQWIEDRLYSYSKIIKGKAGTFAKDYASQHHLTFLPVNSIFINNPTLLGFLQEKQLDVNGDGDISVEELEAIERLSLFGYYGSNPLPADLTELKYAKNMKELGICDYGDSGLQSLDLSPLSGLKELKNLTVEMGNLTNLEGISELSGLTNLSLKCKDGTDINGVGNLKNLTSLSIQSGLKDKDLSFLSGLEKLKHLSLSGNKMEANSITDLKPLMGLNQLEMLDLNDNPITKAEFLVSFHKQYPDTKIWCRNNKISNEEKLKYFAVEQLDTIMCGGTADLNCIETSDYLIGIDGIDVTTDFTATSLDESIVTVETYEIANWMRYRLKAYQEGETAIRVVCGSTTKDIRVSVKALDENKLTPASQLPLLKTVSTGWGGQFTFEYQKTIWNWNENTKRSSKIAALSDTDKKYIARYIYHDEDEIDYAEAMVLDQNHTLWNWTDVNNCTKVEENVKDFDWDSFYYCKDGRQSYYVRSEVQLLKTDGSLKNSVYTSALPDGVSLEDIETVRIDSPMMAILDSKHHVLYYKIPWDRDDAVNAEWQEIDGIYALFEDGTVLTDNQSLGEEAADKNLYTAWIICDSKKNEKKYEAKLSRSESRLVIPKDSELAQERFVRFERIGEKEYLQSEDGIWYEYTITADGAAMLKTDYIDILTSGHVLKGDRILYYNEVPILSQVEGIKCSYDYSFWGAHKTSAAPCGVYAVRTDGSVWFHEDNFGEAKQVFALSDVETSVSGGRGDVNEDGRVDLADVQTVLKAALHIITLSEEQKSAADLHRDKTITMKDAQKILRIVLKIE